jgi:hypothetical protein
MPITVKVKKVAVMNEHASHNCGACGKGSLVSWKSEKWGRCTSCIALAIIGTIMGWSFTVSFGLLNPDKRIALGSACVAMFSTLVLVLHVIVYRLRDSQRTQPDNSLHQSAGPRN